MTDFQTLIRQPTTIQGLALLLAAAIGALAHFSGTGPAAAVLAASLSAALPLIGIKDNTAIAKAEKVGGDLAAVVAAPTGKAALLVEDLPELLPVLQQIAAVMSPVAAAAPVAQPPVANDQPPNPAPVVAQGA